MHLPLRGAEDESGVVPVSEIVCEAVLEVGAALEDEAVSELGSVAEFVFDPGAVRQPEPAFLAFEWLEVDVQMVLEGLVVEYCPLV